MECARTEFKISALLQTNGTLGHVLSGQELFVVVLLALAVAAAVVLTAVWSRDKDRRQAALDVLDRLIRWRP